jgi:hypothetical protein
MDLDKADELAALVTSYRCLIRWYIEQHGELASVELVVDQNPRFENDAIFWEAAPILMKQEKKEWLKDRHDPSRSLHYRFAARSEKYNKKNKRDLKYFLYCNRRVCLCNSPRKGCGTSQRKLKPGSDVYTGWKDVSTRIGCSKYPSVSAGSRTSPIHGNTIGIKDRVE